MTWTGNEVRRLTPLVKAEYGTICHLCLTEITTETQYSIDHLIPRANGGTNAVENLRPAHRRCNSQRGSRPVTEFHQKVIDQTQFFISLPP